MLTKPLKSKNLKPFIILICLLLLTCAFPGGKAVLIEKLAIPVGIAFDIENISPITYRVTTAVYAEDETTTNYIITTESSNLGETRELQSIKLEKKVLYGLERVYIIGEEEAKFGIAPILDLWLVNSLINDRSYVAVYNGKASDMLKYKYKSINNISEYIEQLIKSSYEYNFFPERFNVIDVLTTVGSEGKTLHLPVVKAGAESPEISGLAIFKGDKMEFETGLKESKFINLMSFSKVGGMITVQNGPKSYANVYCDSKRKIECYKNNGKYKFIINLNLKGNLVSNELYKSINTEVKSIKQLQGDVEKVVLKNCNLYIEKIKNQYKLDILNLGEVAAAKYGRDTCVDWNKVVCESDIQVNVKVHILNQGRGEY